MVIDAPLTGIALFGPFQLSVSRRRLERDGVEVRLGGRALDILLILIAQAGNLVTVAELTRQIWGDITVSEGSLRVHINSLRKALDERGGDASCIANVSGRGYSFTAPVTWRSNDDAPGRVEAPAASRLPPLLRRMTGRDDTVEALVDQLRAARFVSIVGSGGIGKTTVAIACAHAFADRFGERTCFIDLGALKDGSLVAATVASSLGLVAPAGNALGAIASYLSDKSVLLIFDNCEHVIETTAALLEHLYYEAPSVYLLTTSREALRVDGEQIHFLLPLETPPEQPGLTTAEIVAYPAVRLFLERAAASGGHVALDDDEAATVAEICQKLDGVALAIELAAGFVGAYGIAGTARLLTNRFKLLRQPGRRTAPPRQQTLNAMVDWSYATLSEREQAVLRRLSIFMGAFTPQAALAIATSPGDSADDVEVAIHNLIAKCLLSTVPIDGVTHYRVLDTTRAYGLERLDENEERPAISARHATYFAAYFEREQQIHGDIVNAQRLERHAVHLGNVRAALEWAFSKDGDGDGDFATRLTAAAARVFMAQSLLIEGYHWASRALRQLDEAQRGGDRELVLLETMAVSLMYTRGNLPEARAAIDRALELAVALGDDAAQFHLLAVQHTFVMRTGDYHGSLQVGARSCEIAERLGTDAARVGAALRHGAGLHAAGRQAEALDSFESGFRRAARMTGTSFIFFALSYRGSALTFLARVLWLRGLPQRAARVAHDAIAEAARSDLPVDVCISLVYSASVFIWLKDWDAADQVLERLATYSRRHALAPYIALGEAFRGALIVHTGDPATGVAMLCDAIGKLRRENHVVVIIILLEAAVAHGLARLGRVDEALDRIDRAITEAEARQVSYEIPELLRQRAAFLLQRAPLDPTGEAEALLVRAVEEAMAGGASMWALNAAQDLAGLLDQKGRPAVARTMLAAAVVGFGDEERPAALIEAEAWLAAESGQTK